jgi:DNA-binding transcriptional regulator YiaG
MKKWIKKEFKKLHDRLNAYEEHQIAILDLVSTLYTYNKAEILALQKLVEELIPDAEITEEEKVHIYACPSSKIDEHYEEDELLHEIETRKRPVRLSENEKKALVRDSKKLTIPELCERYNVSERTVRRALGGKG